MALDSLGNRANAAATQMYGDRNALALGRIGQFPSLRARLHEAQNSHKHMNMSRRIGTSAKKQARAFAPLPTEGEDG
jgi:hypothetical protein